MLYIHVIITIIIFVTICILLFNYLLLFIYLIIYLFIYLFIFIYLECVSILVFKVCLYIYFFEGLNPGLVELLIEMYAGFNHSKTKKKIITSFSVCNLSAFLHLFFCHLS